MSMKTELMRWQDAIEAFEKKDYAKSINAFLEITDIGAKIFFNMGMIYTALDRHQDAAISYTNAIFQDNYLAVAYFQRGVSQWLLHDYEAALESFTDTIEYLRNNTSIDYTQLGLTYKLYSFEAFFNRALCFFALGDEHNAILDLEESAKDAILPVHLQERYRPQSLISAYRNNGALDTYRPFVVPTGLMYRPPAVKIENSESVDYLGKSKVIASSNARDEFTGFIGAKIADALSGKQQEQQQDTSYSHSNSSSINRSRSKHYRSSSMPDGKSSGSSSNVGNRSSRRDLGTRRPSNQSEESTGSKTANNHVQSLTHSPKKIRIKCHYKADKRLMMVRSDIDFEGLKQKVLDKYGMILLRMKYKDEDGEMVILGDDEDLEMAFDSLEIGSSTKLDIFLE